MPTASTSGTSGNAFVSATISKLWSNDAAVRLDASTQLVGHLVKSQQDQQELSEDVNYALRRLVRGLASPRDSSRLGFAVALTEVRPTSKNIEPRAEKLFANDSSWLDCRMQTRGRHSQLSWNHRR